MTPATRDKQAQLLKRLQELVPVMCDATLPADEHWQAVGGAGEVMRQLAATMGVTIIERRAGQ